MSDAAASQPPADEPVKVDAPAVRPMVAWCLMIGLGLAIWLTAAAYEDTLRITDKWRLLAIFMPTILGLMLRPMAGGAIVLLGVVASALFGALTLKDALAGYMEPVVWLVMAAYFFARAFIKTGLARRIALHFVRLLGRTTLGLSYALVLTDTCLAGMIPSNAARVGGVLLPITRGLAELYKSHPGRSAGLIGTFLMLTLYQGDIIACALFYTGQASNPLAAQRAETAQQEALQTGVVPPDTPVVNLNYATWIFYALAPALVSLSVVPWLVYRWCRPEITETPEASEFAQAELDTMGPPSRHERILMGIFLTVVALWIVLGLFYDPDLIYLVALCGAGTLLLSGVITWEDVLHERAAWDVFIWYGGLVQLGKMLEREGVLRLFAESVVGPLGDWHWVPLYLVVLLIYFYAHYAFASITVHILALYPAFVRVLIGAGAPMPLVVASFAFFANFSAGLTHYGTTPAPIIFSLGYVPQGTWWRIGFWLSLVHVAIWLTVGLAWWKLTGLW